MLDKSIPYFDMIMHLDARSCRALRPRALPEGFSIASYQPGDMARWAEIETSVGEFEDVRSACARFEKDYLPFEEELAKRCLFVVGPQGQYVATATAWHDEAESGRCASLGWVGARPELQGMGLGRAVVSAALGLFPALEPDLDVYLHTQTWSHRAVCLYLSLGFRLLKTATFAHRENSFEQAIGALDGVMDARYYEIMLETAL